MDNPTPQNRHLNMSRIRSTNSAPEVAVRSALHKLGFRFRKNDGRLEGTPDIVFPHYHAVIFVNGCF
jgi:DNA mismatch endonuclease, patch repair protein